MRLPDKGSLFLNSKERLDENRYNKYEEKQMIELKIKDYGTIKIELDRKEAPNTCANFTKLVKKGFYDGLIFHRVIRHFMIQGGDPQGIGIGGPGYGIKGEFLANGVENHLSHKRGVVSMARARDPDSAGSQFFICDADDDFLDGQYAAFGHVVEGMDIVDKIAKVRKDANDKPYEDVVIEKATAIDEKDLPVEKIPE